MNSENINNTSPDSDEISLKELILKIQEWGRYLKHKWLIILTVGLLGGLMGFGYAFFKKPIYTATTTFVLEDEKGGGGLGGLAGLASMAGVDLGSGGGGIFQGDNILGLYRSRTMLEKTLLTEMMVDGKSQLLIDRYIDASGLRKKWKDRIELLDLKFNETSNINQINTSDRLKDSVLGIIVFDINKYNLSVAKPDKKVSIIQVDVNSIDEVFAKTFNDQLVENVNEFYIKTKTKKALQNVEILQHKTDSVRAVMNGAIYSAIAVADATPNLNPTRQVQRVAPAQKAQFSAETNKTVLGELVKNLELTKISLLKETPLIQLIDKPIYPLKKDVLGKMKGVIFGGLIGGVLIVLILSAKLFIKSIFSE